MKKLLSKLNPWAVGVGTAALTFGSNAFAAVDTTAITGSFTDAGTAINAIGPLMLTAVGAGIVFKWVLGFVIG